VQSKDPNKKKLYSEDEITEFLPQPSRDRKKKEDFSKPYPGPKTLAERNLKHGRSEDDDAKKPARLRFSKSESADESRAPRVSRDKPDYADRKATPSGFGKPSDSRDSRDSRAPRVSRDKPDYADRKVSPSRFGKSFDPRDTREPRVIHDRPDYNDRKAAPSRPGKSTSDTRDTRAPRDSRDSRNSPDSRTPRDTRGSRDTRDKPEFTDRKTPSSRDQRSRPGFKKEVERKERQDKNSPELQTLRHETLSSKENTWRLNKFIANSGICSRREADNLISEGKVTLNGVVCTELGTKVTSRDKVAVDGNHVNPQDFAYILLNKPKGYITTTEDEKDRRTVMDLVGDATGLRVYPVGRLDRNTTGLLLLTNDGDLANRLMHPSYEVRKIYMVETERTVDDIQIHELRSGIQLEDGLAKAYNVQRVPGMQNVIKLSIFEGRNRQVRRMIEHFGHTVTALHRTTYAGLTDFDLRHGRWRFLKPKEVNDLRRLVKLFDLSKG
jgi:23S rRNA pseudouridine2605 synthase